MSKILSLKDALALREELRKQGKIFVTTNGTFDLLHPGHIQILEQAKQQGDTLLVLLNSDQSVKLNKDPKRPILNEKERAQILSALEVVDHILLFDTKEVHPLLHLLKPDIHVKGGTFIPERIQKEKEILEKYKGKHLCLPLKEGYSTSSLIREILKRYSQEKDI